MNRKTSLAFLIFLAVGNSMIAPAAHAINHHYRDQLIRSGCNEMNAGQGCDITKSKAYNDAHFYHKDKVRDNTGELGQARGVAETVLGTDIGGAADYLLSEGWKPNNGDWFKGRYKLRLVVEGGRVVNGQLMPR